MANIKIIQGLFDDQLRLKVAPAIKAGFPSPAENYLQDSIDFNKDLIKHPESTFYGKVSGDSMIEAGIDDGDIAVIDKSAEAAHNDIVVAYVNGEFTIKYLDLSHVQDGYVELRPANPRYQPIKVMDVDDFEVWGVVLWTIKKWKK